MRLYLIRHPRPSSAIGLCYGRQDVAVDAESVVHAAAAVRERIPERVLKCAEIFSSPASRCMLLARELAAPREPSIAPDLVEMSFGSWEGQAWERVPRDRVGRMGSRCLALPARGRRVRGDGRGALAAMGERGALVG